MRHPRHSEIRQTIRGWYFRSYPAMGYRAAEGPFGWYWDGGRVYVDGLPADRVSEFLSGIRDRYGRRLVTIHLDGEDTAAALGPALEAHGCARGATEVYLAHAGDVPETVTPDGVTVEPVGAGNIEACIATKLRAFSGTEDDPDPQALAEEVRIRGKELNGLGRGELLRADGAPASMVWWYEREGPSDPFYINLVATALPFRGRGIGGYLVTRRLRDFRCQRSGDVVLNVLAANTGAIRLYRRLGFSDQVLLRQHYVYGADPPQ